MKPVGKVIIADKEMILGNPAEGYLAWNNMTL